MGAGAVPVGRDAGCSDELVRALQLVSPRPFQTGREAAGELLLRRWRAAGRRRMWGQGHYFCLFSLLPPAPLPAWKETPP